MDFDRLAPHYRWMEAVFAGGLMRRCRRAFLDEVHGCRRALLVGDGPGSFLATLLASHPDLEVTSVDASAGMLQRAAAQLAGHPRDRPRARFVHEDLREWSPPRATYDLVITQFVLDCFGRDDLDGVIRRLADGASPTAIWLLADFQEPPVGWRRWRARLIVAALYAVFRVVAGLRVTRLPAPAAALREVGFELVARREWSAGLLHSDLWQRGIA